MFRNKRNFSILSSPSAKSAVQNMMQSSPSKRMRLSSTLRGSSLLGDRTNSTEKSPILQQRDADIALTLIEKINRTSSSLVNEPMLPIVFHDTNSKLQDLTLINGFDRDCQSERQQNNNSVVSTFEKDTPPPTPARIESRITVLNQTKARLQVEVENINEQLESKFESIKNFREKTVELRSKNLVFEDFAEIATKSLHEVRNLLNDFYNPGIEQSKRVEMLIQDSQCRHNKKLEKFTFELNHHLDSAKEAIYKKTKQLDHEIEIHERTLMTLECQKRHELSQKVEDAPKSKPQASLEFPPAQPSIETSEHEASDAANNSDLNIICVDKSDHADDDCVIIESKKEENKGSPNNEIGTSARTPDLENPDHCTVILDAANHSESTATCVDEEETDIDEPKEEDEISFTPLQAQRLN